MTPQQIHVMTTTVEMALKQMNKSRAEMGHAPCEARRFHFTLRVDLADGSHIVTDPRGSMGPSTEPPEVRYDREEPL